MHSQPPTIHPNDVIPEGGSMTILCLALGNPIPTISLYIGGHFVRSEIGRHMVTIIQNVTKDMDKVSCQVSNGYGVPMQATRKINISCECDRCLNFFEKKCMNLPLCSCTENSTVGHYVSFAGRTRRIKMCGEGKAASTSDFLARSRRKRASAIRRKL